MVIGMASKKVTVTLGADQVAKIKQLVDSGEATSVSGFVQHAVEVSLQDVAGWGAMLAKALQQSGGPLTGAERAWADGILGAGGGSPSKRRRQRRAA
jgi:Arc/MetJ-type ribon-helix-helix transcriptional regulator